MSLTHSSLGMGESCQRSYLILQWGSPCCQCHHPSNLAVGEVNGGHSFIPLLPLSAGSAVTGCRIQEFSHPFIVSLEYLVPFQISPTREGLHFSSIKHSCFLDGACHLRPNHTRCSAMTWVQVSQLSSPSLQADDCYTQCICSPTRRQSVSLRIFQLGKNGPGWREAAL